jgi:chromosome segregation ATPase
LSETQQTVFLDHPRSHQEWTLFDTPAPVETTENFWRFSFQIAGKKATAFVVRQRRVVQNSTALGGIDDNVLGLWISQRYLDARTEQALREVIALQNERGNHGRQLTLLQQERARIHEEQNRIRQHLQSLGDRASEKDLRERFVRTLGAQEDRLEQIERLQREHTEESERCRRRVEELLDRLEYETRL